MPGQSALRPWAEAWSSGGNEPLISAAGKGHPPRTTRSVSVALESGGFFTALSRPFVGQREEVSVVPSRNFEVGPGKKAAGLTRRTPLAPLKVQQFGAGAMVQW